MKNVDELRRENEALREQVEAINRWYRNDCIALDNKLRSQWRMAVTATTVKKPSENSPIKRARP